jgi:hypothetical protein
MLLEEGEIGIRRKNNTVHLKRQILFTSITFLPERCLHIKRAILSLKVFGYQINLHY